MEPVVYKEIPGWPFYRVGSDGTVWSIKAKGGNDRTGGRLASAWKELSQCPNSNGYSCVNLFKDGKNHIIPVCYLVLETFVGPRPEGMEACHYPDANRRNSRLENLRWDTPEENAKDRWRDRLLSPFRTCRVCGESKPVAEIAKNKRRPDGLDNLCRKCASKLSYSCSDKQKRREAHKRWLLRKAAKV